MVLKEERKRGKASFLIRDGGEWVVLEEEEGLMGE